MGDNIQTHLMLFDKVLEHVSHTDNRLRVKVIDRLIQEKHRCLCMCCDREHPDEFEDNPLSAGEGFDISGSFSIGDKGIELEFAFRVSCDEVYRIVYHLPEVAIDNFCKGRHIVLEDQQQNFFIEDVIEVVGNDFFVFEFLYFDLCLLVVCDKIIDAIEGFLDSYEEGICILECIIGVTGAVEGNLICRFL